MGIITNMGEFTDFDYKLQSPSYLHKIKKNLLLDTMKKLSYSPLGPEALYMANYSK